MFNFITPGNEEKSEQLKELIENMQACDEGDPIELNREYAQKIIDILDFSPEHMKEFLELYFENEQVQKAVNIMESYVIACTLGVCGNRDIENEIIDFSMNSMNLTPKKQIETFKILSIKASEIQDAEKQEHCCDCDNDDCECHGCNCDDSLPDGIEDSLPENLDI